MTSSCIKGSVWVEKKIRKSDLLRFFHPMCLKFGIVGNLEMLITKIRPKLKLENICSKLIAISYRFYEVRSTLQQ